MNMDKSPHAGGVVALQVTVAMAGAFMKASLPMVVTELPIQTPVKPVQPLKAYIPISVTELGISMFVRPTQP